MKKILTACVLTAIATTNFAKEVTISKDEQVQKLAQKIAYGQALGGLVEELYKVNEQKINYKFGWKVNNSAKKQCIIKNFSDTGYTALILPRVKQFAQNYDTQQIQKFIDILDKGLASEMRQSRLATLYTKTPPITMPITTELAQLSLTNTNYNNFMNFFLFNQLEPSHINYSQHSKKEWYQIGYQEGYEWGEKALDQLVKQTTTTCHLN